MRGDAPEIQTAVELHRLGKLDEAEASYRGILRAQPRHPDALHLLGVLSYQRGDPGQARDLIEKAIRIEARAPDFHNNLGTVLRALGRLDEAIAAHRRAIALNPAAAGYHNSLGLVLGEAGAFEEALAAYREAASLKPDFLEAHLNMGVALRALGRFAEAETCYARVLSEDPGNARAHYNLGNLKLEQEKLGEAEACFGAALRCDGGFVGAHLNLGHACAEEGRRGEALRHFRRAAELAPGSVLARWRHCIAQLPLICESEEEAAESRRIYRSELEALRDGLCLATTEEVRAAAEAVGAAQPFYLAYQGHCDRELQEIYGGLVARIQSARYPQWSQPPEAPQAGPGRPVRVGFVSGFFCHHSNWKMPVKGWVENLGRERFRLYGYYTGNKKDAVTEAARRNFHSFSEDLGPLERWCERIRSDRLHVLVFPEIGMDPLTLRLASLRLAPVQCSSWGHPETSGLPTIDYFLSSDLMEPPDADSHYSERLVRLPGLSIYYEPLPVEPARAGRNWFGLREEAVVYLCAQSLHKYLPRYDDVFPRIAARVPGCRFAFLQFSKSGFPGEVFGRRLGRAFARHGLRAEDHVRMISHLSAEHYQALNRCSDVFLDSIGWSGCNSSLEAIGHGLPVVTLPGDLMRGRHSYAFLKRMGVEETVAGGIDEYVELACRLGTDGSWRRQVSERVAAAAPRAYRDRECIAGLEAFLECAASNSVR